MNHWEAREKLVELLHLIEVEGYPVSLVSSYQGAPAIFIGTYGAKSVSMNTAGIIVPSDWKP